MFRPKIALTALLIVTWLALPTGRAEAGWFQQYVGLRAAQHGSGWQLPGGQVVGGGTFAADPWAEAAARQRVPVYTAEQWLQMSTGQAPSPPVPLARPGLPHPVDPRLIAVEQRRQAKARRALLQQWQQQHAPPQPPANGK